MRKFIVNLFHILLVFAVVCCALGCVSSETDYQEGNAQESSEGPAIELISHKLVNENGVYQVEGEAKAYKNMSYVEVDVKFYNAEDKLIYTSFTNVADLAENETWLFSVWGPTDPVTRYEIQIKDTAL
jgi:hypothetical protein